jgi:drug/metabolite transporter (DMT)-like permease
MNPEQRTTASTQSGPRSLREKAKLMNILLIIVAIVAVVLLITGGFVQSLNFLLWVGIVLAIIAVIVWLARMISGRRSV